MAARRTRKPVVESVTATLPVSDWRVIVECLRPAMRSKVGQFWMLEVVIPRIDVAIAGRPDDWPAAVVITEAVEPVMHEALLMWCLPRFPAVRMPALALVVAISNVRHRGKHDDEEGDE